MKILDCTLRDGGFVNDFNWDFDFAKKYYDLMSKFKIHYVELGYWKQTEKSKNPFYNLGFNEVEKITKNAEIDNACVIIDYHYCNKDLACYPVKNQTPISMIRITSRKEDMQKAIEKCRQRECSSYKNYECPVYRNLLVAGVGAKEAIADLHSRVESGLHNLSQSLEP